MIPVVVMQLAVSWIFFDNQWRSRTNRLSEGLAGDIAWVAETYEADPTPANLALLTERAQRTLRFSVSLEPGRPCRSPSASSPFAAWTAPAPGPGQPAERALLVRHHRRPPTSTSASP